MVGTVGEVFGTVGSERKHTNSITETLSHHQAETNQIQQSDMSRQNLLVQALPGGIDGLNDLQSGVVISQKNVDSGQRDQGEVTEKLRRAELGLVTISFVDLANLGGVNLLGEGGEVRNHSGDIPNFLMRLHHLFLLSGSGLGLSSVVAETLELVHKLVNHIPKPNHRQFQRSTIGAKEMVEKVAVVLPRFELLLKGRLKLGVDVAVKQLTVQHQKHLIVLNKGGDSANSGPRRGLEISFSQLLETDFVNQLNLRNVSIRQVSTEESNKVLNFFGKSNIPFDSLSFSHVFFNVCKEEGEKKKKDEKEKGKGVLVTANRANWREGHEKKKKKKEKINL